MNYALSGVKIAIVGGDRRELVLATELVALGAAVTIVGFPNGLLPHGAALQTDVAAALTGAQAVVLPLSGVDKEGMLRTVYTGEKIRLSHSELEKMAAGALLLTGSAGDSLQQDCARLGIRLEKIGEWDELAILNSIPTAEGAIQLAMQETDVTIHGTPCTVIGFGRVGMTLARDLKALGAEVMVASRNRGELARAREMGCGGLLLRELTQAVAQGGMIFNTIPAMVLTREVLRHARPGLFILDLASRPGGTDFEAAADYGVKAMMAPGLPGKAAAYSAGKILAELIPRILKEYGVINPIEGGK